MADELERDETGAAKFFSVRQHAWHRLGKVLGDNPSFEDALRDGGLDTDVEKRPYFLPTGTGDFYESPDAFYTVRTDTGARLGTRLGPDYHVVQNRDAFELLQPLVDRGLLRLETGGSLRGGVDAFLSGLWNVDEMPDVVRTVFRDELAAYAAVVNNHAGQRGVIIQLTPVRIVCANTLAVSLSGKSQNRMKVRHSSGAANKLVDAALNLFGGVVQGFADTAVQYQALREKQISQTAFRLAVLDLIAPEKPAKESPTGRNTAFVQERIAAKRALLSDLWTNGTGHSGDHSAWEAFNAVTEALDHHRDVFPTGDLGASLLDGQFGQFKSQALSNLLKV